MQPMRVLAGLRSDVRDAVFRHNPLCEDPLWFSYTERKRKPGAAGSLPAGSGTISSERWLTVAPFPCLQHL
jgi:hypothetical protein